MWPGTVSRRGFIAGAAGLSGAIALGVIVSTDSSTKDGLDLGLDLGLGEHPDPVAKEIVLELLSTAENSTKNWKSAYSYIEDISDGRGYTAGIVGWCSGTGDMLALVQHHAATTPGNVLQKYIPGLEKVMEAPYDRRPDLSHALLGAPFIAAWRAAAKTATFQAAQQYERDRIYWKPALAAATRDGLSLIGLYLYYDINVNHGPGSDLEAFDDIVAGVKARGYRVPAKGGDEVAYLSEVIAARDAVLRSWGTFEVAGRSSIAQKFLTEGNLSLKLPLRWTVYGDSFSITTRPTP